MKTLSISILLLIGFSARAQYTNLVLEGGGMKGIAYAGAFEVLDSLGITKDIERIGGSSSGAMNGMMLAFGYTGEQIRHLNLETKFQKYNQVGIPLISGLIRLKRTYGFYKSDRLIQDLGKLIVQKGYDENITFGEMQNLINEERPLKELHITGANLTDQKIEIFNFENYPDMKILDAIRISISIPVYFEALFVSSNGKIIPKKEADSNTKVMVDGGILDNYPFYIFDTLVSVNQGRNQYYKCNQNTLGIKLENDNSKEYIASKKVENTTDYMQAFGLLSSEYLNRRHLGKKQKAQTIFINTHNFNPKIKRHKKKEKVDIMNYGKYAAKAFFMSTKGSE